MLDPNAYDATANDKEDFKLSLIKYMTEAGIEKKDLTKTVETVKLCLDYLHDLDPKWRVVRARGFSTKIKLHGVIYQTIINLLNSKDELKRLHAKELKLKEQENEAEKSEH